MDRSDDLQHLYGAIHHKVTGELLYLMDGLFQNIEDGLGEIGFRDPHRAQRCLILLRDMQAKRSTLIHLIAERMQNALQDWFSGQMLDVHDHDEDLAIVAREMSKKSMAHFGSLLNFIAQRSAHAFEEHTEQRNVPISPYHVSRAFLESCRNVKFNAQDIEILQELFERYVLDRLGTIYGECNQRLMQAGFLTERELAPEVRA